MTRSPMPLCPECSSVRVHRTAIHHRRYRFTCADCHWVGKLLSAATALAPSRRKVVTIPIVPAPEIIYSQ